MKVTRYFHDEVIVKRPYLKMEWIENVIGSPLKKEMQEDGRIRYWGYVDELQRVIRVVTLADGTIHNAFPDRNFRKE
jgi:hypothetical protein